MVTVSPPRPAQPTREGRDTPTQRRSRWLSPALLLISPSALFMLLIFGWPLVTGVVQAFQTPDGVGFGNVSRLFADGHFSGALRNTVLLIVILLPLQFVFAVVMAFLINSRPRFRGFYFYLWALPLAVSDLAAGLVWLSIFTDRGYINSLLNHVGIGPVSWLNYQSPGTQFLTIVVAELWRATSLVMVIVVAGMQGIAKDYDEAANVFGAGFLARVRHVWLPMLRPSLQVALILRTIAAFETFAVAQALTGQDFELLVGETYRYYELLQNPNVAAVLALFILVISIGCAVLYLRLLRDDATREAAR